MGNQHPVEFQILIFRNQIGCWPYRDIFRVRFRRWVGIFLLFLEKKKWTKTPGRKHRVDENAVFRRKQQPQE